MLHTSEVVLHNQKNNSKLDYFYSDKIVMNKKFSFITIFFVFLNFFLFSQNLPRGYKNINLGMSLQETKDELIKNTDFGYKGNRDVSLIPGKPEVLIETDADKGMGSNFLNRCWFQFYNDSLYTIIINFNSKKIDYYSLFTTLKNKYGEPKEVNPQYSVWENNETIVFLEKDLSIKYIDAETFNQLQTTANIEKSAAEITQQMFLDEL